VTTTEKATKCDTPVELPGGLTAGCTLMVPPHTPGTDCRYERPAERFAARIVFCPVCGSTCGDTSEPTEDTGAYACDNCDCLFRLDDARDGLDNVPGDEASAMAMCPLCQVTSDVKNYGTSTITCPEPSCGVVYTIQADQDAFVEFSMFG
jgi:hypothetical protein